MIGSPKVHKNKVAMIPNLPKPVTDLFLGNPAIEGVVLFGGFARKMAEDGGDIDVLVITKCTRLKTSLEKIENYQLDIVTGSEEQFLRSLYLDRKTNQNVILVALHEGIILIDRRGTASRLVAGARDLWRYGPLPPSQTEIIDMRVTLQRIASKVSRISCRASTKSQKLTLYDLELPLLFMRCIVINCRSHRLWCANLQQLLLWRDQRYEILREAIESFILHPDLQERCILLRSLISRTQEVLGI